MTDLPRGIPKVVPMKSHPPAKEQARLITTIQARSKLAEFIG